MEAFASLIYQLSHWYKIVLIIYILSSWFPAISQTAFGNFLAKVSEPYLNLFRRFIPPIGRVDISPIIAIVVLQYATYGLLKVLGF